MVPVNHILELITHIASQRVTIAYYIHVHVHGPLDLVQIILFLHIFAYVLSNM